MREMYFNKPDRLMMYPSHRVCAIIDERNDASMALDALIKSGTKEEDIEILFGREGIDLLDPKGNSHGFFAKISNKFRAFGDIGKTLVRIYESALRRGGYVFVVPSYDENDKEHIRKSLSAGKAREINYFSTWFVESM